MLSHSNKMSKNWLGKWQDDIGVKRGINVLVYLNSENKYLQFFKISDKLGWNKEISLTPWFSKV
jgi:hypothetical protein